MHIVSQLIDLSWGDKQSFEFPLSEFYRYERTTIIQWSVGYIVLPDLDYCYPLLSQRAIMT